MFVTDFTMEGSVASVDFQMLFSMGDSFEHPPTFATFIRSLIRMWQHVLFEGVFCWEIFRAVFALVGSLTYQKSTKATYINLQPNYSNSTQYLAIPGDGELPDDSLLVWILESYTNGGKENNFVSLDILGVPCYFRKTPKLIFLRKTVSSKSFCYYFPHITMKYCLMEMY